MSITYSAQAGTQITSALVGVASLATQTGNADQVQIPATAGSTAPSTADDYNSNVGDGTNGLGDTYVGRLCMLRKGTGTQETRIINAASYASNVVTLTVNEDWDTAPANGDAFDICYEPGDIEDGGAGGGINLNSRTGLYELSNTLTLNSGGFLQVVNGNALELDDDGNNVSMLVQSGGYYLAGLETAGAYISGGVQPSYNNTAGEPSLQIASGGNAFIYDTLFWAQLVAQQLECANGSNGNFYRVKWLNLTQELILYDATVIDCSVGGKGGTSEVVRVDAGTTVNGLVLANIDTLDSAADTTTETIELEGVLFAGVTDYINVRNNKTWNLIDPVWNVTTYTDLVWVGSTSNTVNDRRSIKATVAEADGTALASALVNVYENTQLADLVLELTTDSNGYAEDSFIYKAHVTNSATTTYGGHALQAGKWLYLPFVAAQVSTEAFQGTIVLSPDPNIVQTTQATAITDGSGITWNEDTNPSSIIEFTSGSGGTVGLAVGDTITGASSGADGIVTDILEGDGTAGTIHLKTRDANAFTNGETIGNGADGWTATYTANTQQDFSIWIDGNTKSFQTLYDYLAARQTETTLSATGELIWEWCRSAQTQPLYNTGSSFYTGRSNSKGIIVVNSGAGSVDYFTDDAGTTWTPPTSVTLTVNVEDSDGNPISGVRVRIETSPGGTLIAQGQTNASGVFTAAYTYTVDQSVLTKVRLKGYKFFRTGGTIESSGLTVGATLQKDPITYLP